MTIGEKAYACMSSSSSLFSSQTATPNSRYPSRTATWGSESIPRKTGRIQDPLESRFIPEPDKDIADGKTSMDQFSHIHNVLAYRAFKSPKAMAFMTLDMKGRDFSAITWEKLASRAEKVAQLLHDKSGLTKDARVGLYYRDEEVIDFAVALYGCFIAGVAAVPISCPCDISEMSYILSRTQSHLVLTSDINLKSVQKELVVKKISWPRGIEWWKTNEFGSYKKTKRIKHAFSEFAYIEFSRAPTGELRGVVISHKTIMAQMYCIAAILESKPQKHSSHSSHNVITPNTAIDSLSTQTKSPASEDIGLSNMSSINNVDVNIPSIPDHIASANTAATGTSPSSSTSSSTSSVNLSSISGMSKSKNTILTYLDTRTSIGLILSLIYSVYSGAELISAPSSTVTTPGLFAHLITKFRASIILADYPGLKQICYNYQSFPLLTRNYSKKIKVNLSSINWCLIDCLAVDPEFHEILADRWLKPLGHRKARKVPAPILTLSEHGGMFISIRDWLGHEDRLGCKLVKPSPDDEYSSPSDLSEILLDKTALSTNTVHILSTSPSREAFDEDTRTTVRVGAFGYPIPDSILAIVDPETCQLSSELVIGEIWVDSPSLSGGFWGMDRATKTIFRAKLVNAPEHEDTAFLRTGLLGFIYSGKVYVLGLYEDRLRQREYIEHKDSRNHLLYLEGAGYLYHYSSHLVQTIIRGVSDIYDCATFDVFLDEEHYPIVLVETPIAISTPIDEGDKPIELDMRALRNLSEKVFSILFEVHKVRVYCIMITAPHALPRTTRNGRREIGNMLCKRKYEMGNIPAVYVRYGVNYAVMRIPMGVDPEGSIWSKFVSEIRKEVLFDNPKQFTGIDNRLTIIDEKSKMALENFKSIIEILALRSSKTPDEPAFINIDSRGKESKPLTWKKLDSKIAGLIHFIRTKAKLKVGDHAILVYPHGEDFIIAVLACLCLGIIPLPVGPLDASRLNEDSPAFLSIVTDYKVLAIFVNQDSEHALKDSKVWSHLKQCAKIVKTALPRVYSTSKAKSSSSIQDMRAIPSADLTQPGRTALVWLYWSEDHRRTAVSIDHKGILGMCKVQKTTCQMSNENPLVACVRSTVGIGFVYTCFLGIYLSTLTYLVSPVDFAINPMIFYAILSRYRIKDAYATPQMIQHSMSLSFRKGLVLKHLKNLTTTYDLRTDMHLNRRARTLFLPMGIKITSLNSAYCSPVNPMISTRAYMDMEPIDLWLDPIALRKGFISIVDPASCPQALYLQDSGMVPVQTQIAIVNPETCELCRTGEYGEIWVSSEANVTGIYQSKSPIDLCRFNVEVKDDEVTGKFARTGDLGFLHTVQRPHGLGGEMIDIQALFVIGRIGESFDVCGLNHFPMDIELSIEKNHRAICNNGVVVYICAGLVVVIVEATRLSYLPSLVPIVVNSMFSEHQLLPDVVSFVKAGSIPRSRFGEKQRGKLLHLWLSHKLTVEQQFYISDSRSVVARQNLTYTKANSVEIR